MAKIYRDIDDPIELEVLKENAQLGNVPNVTTNNQTPTWSMATTLANIVSGETLTKIMGKISKAINDIISHIGNKSNPHGVTKSQVGLGNVGNYKAVSTVASQGLTTTEQSNARANIGAGTSNFSGNYNDLTNKPTLPTVNNATLTIQKNGTDVGTFTANASANKDINITVPTKTSELTNDSGYKTTDNNTTYTLTKNGSTISLTGSDGSKTSVTDSNTTYTLSSFGVTATAAELNKLDGCTATVTELNYVDGVTSNIQTQLNGKLTSSSALNPSNISDGYTTKSFYLNTHPENSGVIIPFINNDLAFMLKRGGSAKVYYDDELQSTDISAVFNGSPSYWIINPTGVTNVIIELTLHKTFTWTNQIYVDFGSAVWRAKNIKIEVMNSNVADDTWVVKGTNTNNSLGNYKITMSHLSGTGFNKIRFTFSNFNSATIFRIACLGVINFGSAGLRETFVPKDGGEIYGRLIPYTNNSIDLGSSSKQFRTVYGKATSADSATKATNDSLNQNIADTYIKTLSVNGRVITYTKGDGGTGTITTQDTNTTYSQATSSTLGLVKIGYTENGKNYPVELSNGQMFVNVPWTDTNTTYGVATSSKLGLVKSGTDITVDSSGNVSVVGGDVNTAQTLKTARTINGVSFNGSANITITANPKENQLTNQNLNDIKTSGEYYAGGSNRVTNKPSNIDAFSLQVVRSASGYYTQILIGGNNNPNKMFIRTYQGGTWTSWYSFYSSQYPQTSVSGNAGTATKLQTARKIAGTSFDGTKDISISYNNLTDKPTIPSGVQVINNLTSSSTTASLAANQGRVLKGYLDKKIVVSSTQPSGQQTGDTWYQII